MAGEESGLQRLWLDGSLMGQFVMSQMVVGPLAESNPSRRPHQVGNETFSLPGS
jgi:hypothetical protein